MPVAFRAAARREYDQVALEHQLVVDEDRYEQLVLRHRRHRQVDVDGVAAHDGLVAGVGLVVSELVEVVDARDVDAHILGGGLGAVGHHHQHLEIVGIVPAALLEERHHVVDAQLRRRSRRRIVVIVLKIDHHHRRRKQQRCHQQRQQRQPAPLGGCQVVVGGALRGAGIALFAGTRRIG